MPFGPRAFCQRSVAVLELIAGLSMALGCGRVAPPGAAEAQTAGSSVSIVASPSAPSATRTPSMPSAQSSGPTCPTDMVAIPGGPFWVGTSSQQGDPEEMPRYRTQLAPFCLDRTEVTVDAYSACVAARRCAPAYDKWRSCNATSRQRGRHPINCVDWARAEAYCAWRGGRLPTEVEWEFAARGGERYLKYPWGGAPPDGLACWKHVGGSCEVAQYPAGAFGLFDLTGNVYEWTSSWFGPYPWPPQVGASRVYRGGSWSRRFEKWMSTTQRNRFAPEKWGSHLGFRCALTVPGTSCPFQASEDGRGCLHGVTNLQCKPPAVWNGLRCAREGEPACKAGRTEVPGHGCVTPDATTGSTAPEDLTAVSRTRSPEFDADCSQYHPDRPHAYRYAGGTHQARNMVSRRAGCGNRDVGVGWNSTCCP